jgi:hypothetical protein
LRRWPERCNGRRTFWKIIAKTVQLFAYLQTS